MSRVSKKEDQFYVLFQELADKMVVAADCYYDIVSTYPKHANRITEMKDYEIDCDREISKIFDLLNNSFVTPFDREDISALILKMDDVVDDMENVSRRYELFHMNATYPEAEQMAALGRDAVHDIQVLFQHFSNFRKDKEVQKQAGMIHDIEDQGDHVYHSALAKLFDEENVTATHLLKWDTIFGKMEDILDDCKTVATLVANVVLKNA